MASSYSTLNYDACSIEELQRFVKARLGVELTGARDRAGFVSVLRQADRAFRFRFLDLAPELRNIVYRELLTLRPRLPSGRSGRFCWPQLLAASKVIHSEAESILYGENAFQVHLSLERGAARTRLDVTGSRTDGYWSIRKPQAESLGQAYLEWPTYLRKFQQIEVVIVAGVRSQDYHHSHAEQQTFSAINFELYSLASYLGYQHCLKSLSVKIYIRGHEAFADVPVTSVWPLAKLGPVEKLTIHGVAEHTHHLLVEASQDFEFEHCPPLVCMSDLCQEAEKLHALARLAGLHGDKLHISERKCFLRKALRDGKDVCAERDQELRHSYSRLKILLGPTLSGKIKAEANRRDELMWLLEDETA